MKVVVWENSTKDDFGFFGEIFFDFVKPLQILDGDGWDPDLRFIEKQEQFVLTLSPGLSLAPMSRSRAARTIKS